MTWPPPRVYRALAPAAVLTLLTSCATLPLAAAPTPTAAVSSSAPVVITAVVETPGTTPLKLRSKPSTESKVLAELKKGATVTLICQIDGERIRGTQGTTPVWDKVSYQKKTGYLSAAYLKGGVNSAVPRCPEASASPSASATSSAAPSPASTVRGALLEQRIIEIARSQLGVKETKNNCNPYGGCMAWCSLFSTWVWRKAGDPIPSYAFTGNLYTWGKKKGRIHDTLDGVGPGDMVLYGTGPQTVKSSVHVDIVIEVFDDHLRVIGGNVDDKVVERDVPKTGIYAWLDA